MITTIHSRVAIQARIAEWHRQHRTSDYRPTEFLFGGSQSANGWCRLAPGGLA